MNKFGACKLIVRLIQHELACGWQRGLVGTSTAAHPFHRRPSRSIHHRKQGMCVGMDLEATKLLLLIELM